MKILQSNIETKESKKARKNKKKEFILTSLNRRCNLCGEIICDGSNTYIPRSGGCKCGY